METNQENDSIKMEKFQCFQCEGLELRNKLYKRGKERLIKGERGKGERGRERGGERVGERWEGREGESGEGEGERD